MHTYSYEDTHANPTSMSIFADRIGKSLKLTKSPHVFSCKDTYEQCTKLFVGLNIWNTGFGPIKVRMDRCIWTYGRILLPRYKLSYSL